jgi:hypothetical protein
MLEVLGIFEDEETFISFNCETGVDPQHLRGFFPGLLKLSRLRIGGCQRMMGPLEWRMRYLIAPYGLTTFTVNTSSRALSDLP